MCLFLSYKINFVILQIFVPNRLNTIVYLLSLYLYVVARVKNLDLEGSLLTVCLGTLEVDHQLLGQVKSHHDEW